jgi:hypothetical protein
MECGMFLDLITLTKADSGSLWDTLYHKNVGLRERRKLENTFVYMRNDGSLLHSDRAILNLYLVDTVK